MAALSTPSGLLFITANRIGDAVLSSGVLGQLMAANPDQPVTVACGPVPAGLFADLPNLERIHPLVRRGRIGHWWDLWRATRPRHWQVVADLRGSLIGWTLTADRRLMFRPAKRHEHRIEELARQLRLPDLPQPQLWIAPSRQAKAREILGETTPILAVGPTANWGAKQWPADRFADAVTRLTGPGGILAGARVAVFGTESERAMAAPVLAAVPAERRLDCIGTTHLLDAAALLQCCSFYFGNDSGLMHLAAAAGIPTLGLFGPSPEWRYRPWGARTAVVRTPESYEDLVGAADFDHRRQASLMTGLTVDAVVEAAEALWNNASRCR
ncbi:glycosyltransferase family 9 protein [Telmatospirillum sp.]|uniref:glycosyltransferase family 9 protein n=1 Tax=Telmatospirillum sp. TaxID=2079197 RepID=UPI00285031E0|nr:glycosyltransferase family 9 protein [Telmatospirillum sp.]MDR3441054.1 glycosyltransferase family 9 protein [Telmatospirillum sp.]